MVHHPTTFLSWTAPEYVHQKNNADWHWALWVIGILLTGLSIYLENYILTALVVLATIITATLSHRKPEEVRVEMSGVGISLNKKHYPYEEILAFWIDTEDHLENKLLLYVNKPLLPIESVLIDAENIDLVGLRDILIDLIPETKMREPFSVRMAHKVGLF